MKLNAICNHSDNERALVNTWTTKELKKAIETGYQILEIYKVLHWERKSKDLFSDYIKKWLRIKQEASGYPNWVKNDSDEETFIQNYLSKEDIILDKFSIVKNPALRAIAKLMLNSF